MCRPLQRRWLGVPRSDRGGAWSDEALRLLALTERRVTSSRAGLSLPTRSLVRLCAAVDLILEAVEKATEDSPGPAPRDLTDAFLGAAYGRAHRCMRSIRELAGRGEADDALILTRSLLTIVARSLYIVEPDDPKERERRLASWRLSWGEQALRILDDLSAAGFEPIDDRERIAGIVETERAQGVQPLPNDRDLLAGLGLAAYYARVYRPASDVVHYSMGNALGGFAEYPDHIEGGGRVMLKRPDADRAEEALGLATIIYGEFLERCEPVIRHGVSPEARRLMAEYLNDPSGGSHQGDKST